MMTSMLSEPRQLLRRHSPVGASTGYMEESRGEWDELVEHAVDLSPFAIEFAALSEGELPGLLEYFSGEPLLSFRYVSVHAPSKELAMPEPDLVKDLAKLPRWIDAVVVHPDVIGDPANYAPLGRRLVLENMDKRKENGRSVEELQGFFEQLPEAGLCFDVAHAASIDASMEEGARILDAFAGRLRHVHLSSLDEASHHVSLRPDDEERFAGLLSRCRDVPWILEAPPSNG
jgi:Xylose isomerase-like TIM barrel